MTEVDYSPEAYERYLRTRNRVANWAAESSSNAAHYTHPFDSHQPRPAVTYGSVPEVRPDDSISLYDGGAAKRREQERSRSQPRSHAHGARPSHSRSITHDAHRSHRSQQVAPAPQQMYYMQQGSQYVLPGQQRVVDLSQYHGRSTSRDIHLPAGRGGESYMIIPPRGKRIEVVVSDSNHPSYSMLLTHSKQSPSGGASQTHYFASSPASPNRHNSRSSSRAHSPSPGAYVYGTQVYPTHGHSHSHGQGHTPQKKKESQPLLKRLFTGVTWDKDGKDKDKHKDKPHQSGRRRSY
jgi:hypothetical protein